MNSPPNRADTTDPETEAWTAGFRLGYGHGYGVGRAHGYDAAHAEMTAEWAAFAAHIRRVRTGRAPGTPRSEQEVAAAVASAERLARSMAWRHWDEFTTREARGHRHGRVAHRRRRPA